MKKIFSLTMMIVFSAVLIISTLAPALAEEEGSRAISIKVKYGTKDRTARVYDIIAEPVVKTLEGETALAAFEEEDESYGFKLELTSTVGDNPSLIKIDMKAWELRVVEEDGKSEKKYVILTEQKLNIIKGGTSVTDIAVGNDRNVQILITPNYEY